MADGNTQEQPIELMTLSDAYETIAFVALNQMRAQKTAAHYARVAQQNAETAIHANKAADSLGKQLKEAQEKVAALTPPPAAEPAPGPVTEVEAAKPTDSPLPIIGAAKPLEPKGEKTQLAAAAAQAVGHVSV